MLDIFAAIVSVALAIYLLGAIGLGVYIWREQERLDREWQRRMELLKQEHLAKRFYVTE